jgi:predicted flap endonuclease-1-like 5' DNA nuclease
MNFWTGLLLGLIIGWVIEWIIDRMFWRREAAEVTEQDALVQERLATAEKSVTQLDMEWQNRLAAAEEDYQTRLAAVEQEWQDRLNLNEEQWQAQFAQLETDNESLHSRLAGATVGAALAGATVGAALATAGAVAVFDHEDAADEVDDIDELDARFEAIVAGAVVAEALDADEEIPETLTVELEPELEEPVTGPLVHDDLARIHGIGPKYAQLLAASGIGTFARLAAATPDELREAIDPEPRQQINFESWIAQAVAFNQTRALQVGDDLTLLEGIGPVYASRLRDNGITTYAELADTDETALAEIIDAPAWRRIDYGDWITQARLAAAGDLDSLKSVQDQLFRREGDNLLLIRGLGERSAGALQAAGVATFAALAAASPDRLESIIRDAGVRGDFDYDGWITEATLRASGRRIARERPAPTHVVPCPQDLSAVNGLGTVYEDRLYSAGIGSYWELAETPTADLATILAIQSYQDVDLPAIKASAMQLAVETNSLGRAWDGTPPDNFEALEGLGEIYERRLYEAGICTYDALMATSAEQLAKICNAPPMHTPDYNAWIATAVEMVTARRSG